jgi:hypothetical protein
VNHIERFTARAAIATVDSDGNIHETIAWLEAAGIQGLMPMEQRAGNDLARIRREHPRWLMVGGYDKTLMHRGEPAMRAEFERLGPVMRQGGFIPSVQAGRSSAAPAASLSPMPPPRRPRQLSPQLELTCCA